MWKEMACLMKCKFKQFCRSEERKENILLWLKVYCTKYLKLRYSHCKITVHSQVTFVHIVNDKFHMVCMKRSKVLSVITEH